MAFTNVTTEYLIQTRDYIKVGCESYINGMLMSHASRAGRISA